MAPRVMNPSLSIGQVPARTGLAVSAIRFFETRGLMRPVCAGAGRRRNHPVDIRRPSFALVAQQPGFSLEEIGAELGKLPQRRAPTRKDRASIRRSYSGVLQQRMDTMRRLQERLDGRIGCGCPSLGHCALCNPHDRAARQGSGPRFVPGDEA